MSCASLGPHRNMTLGSKGNHGVGPRFEIRPRDLWSGKHRLESTMEGRPCGRTGTHPGDGFDNLRVSVLQIVEKNRLMVGNAIAEPAQGIEAAMHAAPFYAPSVFHKCRIERLSPQRGIIAWTEEANPEAKTQFGDNGSDRKWFSRLLKIANGVVYFLHRILLQRGFPGLEPARPISFDKLVIEFVSEANFHALQRGIKRF